MKAIRSSLKITQYYEVVRIEIWKVYVKNKALYLVLPQNSILNLKHCYCRVLADKYNEKKNCFK